MTKKEITHFGSMVSRIAQDIRRQLHTLEDSDSGTRYVMVPLVDVLSEIKTFTDTVKHIKRGKT